MVSWLWYVSTVHQARGIWLSLFLPGLCVALEPTLEPTLEPSFYNSPSNDPTVEPTLEPTFIWSSPPTIEPTVELTFNPTVEPTIEPTVLYCPILNVTVLNESDFDSNIFNGWYVLNKDVIKFGKPIWESVQYRFDRNIHHTATNWIINGYGDDVLAQINVSRSEYPRSGSSMSV
eukprot:186774_1